MIAHLLTPGPGEHAAPASSGASPPGHHDLQELTDIVSRAADTINELGRRNKVLEAEARRAIEAQMAEADAARGRAAELQAHADFLETRIDEMAADFQGYVLDLQGKLTSCRAELELRTRDAELSREWLAYLSSEIMDRLGDAPAKLNELARETRAGLRRADLGSFLPENSLMGKNQTTVRVSCYPDGRSGSADLGVHGKRLRRRYAALRLAGPVL